MLSGQRVQYASSIVLGLNDAIVELTGALAGLTLALQNTKLIAITGLITGIAASLSMAASGYLSAKEEGHAHKNPVTSALYTGIAYILAVILLVLPYFLYTNVFHALATTIGIAIAIIAWYTYFIAQAKNHSFRKRFIEMATISLTVAVISFAVGYAVRIFIGVDI